MARKTIYCAQAFWRRGGRLQGGQIHQFLNAERAMEGGEILAAGADGAAVFSLTGEPDVDYWDEPVLLATFGNAPGSPGRPAPEPWEADAA
jgi:hypothetical protein